ncbi:XRE family transcriptional regulator [Erysipelotrichaceae bacterium 66-17]
MNKYLIERIKEARKDCGMSQKEVADILGINRSTIASYETGNSEPDIDTYIKLCKIYNANYVDILNKAYELQEIAQFTPTIEEEYIIEKIRDLNEEDKVMIVSLIERLTTKSSLKVEDVPIRYVTLPAYGYAPSAGTGNYMPDDIPASTIQVPESPSAEKADFVVRVSGHSMEPKFMDGDLVLVKKTEVLDPGKIGIFSVNGEALIKEYFPDRLHSLNAKYKDIDLNDGDTVRCLGEVIGKL